MFTEKTINVVSPHLKEEATYKQKELGNQLYTKLEKKLGLRERHKPADRFLSFYSLRCSTSLCSY